MILQRSNFVTFTFLLGICGGKAAPLPRLCFTQLALPLLSYYLCSKKHYITDGLTDTHNYSNRYIYVKPSYTLSNPQKCLKMWVSSLFVILHAKNWLQRFGFWPFQPQNDQIKHKLLIPTITNYFLITFDGFQPFFLFSVKNWEI